MRFTVAPDNIDCSKCCVNIENKNMELSSVFENLLSDQWGSAAGFKANLQRGNFSLLVLLLLEVKMSYSFENWS